MTDCMYFIKHHCVEEVSLRAQETVSAHFLFWITFIFINFLFLKISTSNFLYCWATILSFDFIDYIWQRVGATRFWPLLQNCGKLWHPYFGKAVIASRCLDYTKSGVDSTSVRKLVNGDRKIRNSPSLLLDGHRKFGLNKLRHWRHYEMIKHLYKNVPLDINNL